MDALERSMKSGVVASFVADVSTLLEMLGIRRMIFLISSWNPNSSDLSNSSKIKILTGRMSMSPRVRWSSNLPGVLMIMSGVAFSEFFSSSKLCPP